jgi:hypothetical protein
MFLHSKKTRISIIFLFLIVSCAPTKSGSSLDNIANQNNAKSSEVKKEESPSNNYQVDLKKLGKEAAYMVGWDVVLAVACKGGLHLSVGVCLAADVLGDVGIITYTNLTEKEVNKNEESGKELSQKESSSKRSKNFNPIEFIMGVGLMAMVLILI